MIRTISAVIITIAALLALSVLPALANQPPLTVERSEDRLSATASWTPSADAQNQRFFYVGKLLLGEENAIGIGVNLYTYKDVPLAGDANSLAFDQLDPAREYLYGVGNVATDADGKTVWSDIRFAGFPPPTSAATDRAALVALYNATDGDNWRDNANWLSDAPLGDWRGVTTDADGRVTGIELWLNKLNGPLPPELGDLAKLQRLNLALNDLNGPLPPELGNLYGGLQDLTLLGNQLSGEIPVQYGGLYNLEKLYLSVGNNYAGCIPAALQNAPVNDLSDLGLPFCS